MSLKVYKSGQGYWTRMGSGLGMGIVLVVGVLWLWRQLGGWSYEYRIYVAAAVAVALLLSVGLIIFRFVGSKPRSVDFLIATEGEMKKVNWPTRKEVIGSTWIVICGLAMIVAIVFIADFLFAELFTQIGVLDFKPGDDAGS